MIAAEPRAGRFPVATMLLGAAAVAVQCLPALAGWLEFQRGAVAGGQGWRWITGHLTHATLEHLLWDLGAFLLLGALCERRGRRRMLVGLGLAALLIPAVVSILQPEVETYRGLSGLNSALFTLLVAGFIRESIARRAWFRVGFAIALLIGFAAKTAHEAATGVSFFVSSETPSTVMVPLAHTAGAAIGLLVGFGSAKAERRMSRDRVETMGRQAGHFSSSTSTIRTARPSTPVLPLAPLPLCPLAPFFTHDSRSVRDQQ